MIAAGAMASGKGHYAWTQRAKQRSETWRRQVASMERAFQVLKCGNTSVWPTTAMPSRTMRMRCQPVDMRWRRSIGCSPLEGRRGTSKPRKTVASVLQSTSVSCEIPGQQFGGVTA